MKIGLTMKTKRKHPTVTAIPREIWAIDTGLGFLLPPLDDDGTDTFMAWPTKEEAEQGLRHQAENGWCEYGKVVRIK